MRSDLEPVVFLNAATPSSLYKPMSFLLYFLRILFNIELSTNSQTLAQSYTPMVTSKRFPSLFIQGFSLLNKSDFLAWYITCMSSLLISVIFFAKLSALINSFSDIDEQKSFMSKIGDLYLFLSGILRNHPIHLCASFHCLILRKFLSQRFMLLRMLLLIRRIIFRRFYLVMNNFLKLLEKHFP